MGMSYEAFSTNKDGAFQPFAFDDWVGFVSMQYCSSGHPSSVFRMEKLFTDPEPSSSHYQPEEWLTHLEHPIQGATWVFATRDEFPTPHLYVADQGHILSRYKLYDPGYPSFRDYLEDEYGYGYSVDGDRCYPNVVFIATDDGLVEVNCGESLEIVSGPVGPGLRGQVKLVGWPYIFVAGVTNSYPYRAVLASYKVDIYGNLTLNSVFTLEENMVYSDPRYFALLTVVGPNAYVSVTARSKYWCGGSEPIPIPDGYNFFRVDISDRENPGWGERIHPQGHWGSIAYLWPCLYRDSRGTTYPDKEWEMARYRDDGFPSDLYNYTDPIRNYYPDYVRPHYMSGKFFQMQVFFHSLQNSVTMSFRVYQTALFYLV